MYSTVAVDQLSVFNEFKNTFNLKNKTILEIGGAIPYEKVSEVEVKEWVSIDPINDSSFSKDNYKRIRGVASHTLYPDDYFDYVFSCNAFEHINDLSETIKELKKVLKTGGKVFAHFGPIWSAPDGHHLDINFKDHSYNFWEESIIPHWFHLLFESQELKEILTSQFDSDFVDQVIKHTYENKWINRLFYEDYINIFIESGLTIEHLTVNNEIDYQVNFPNYHHSLVDNNSEQMIKEILKNKYMDMYKNFNCRDIKVVLSKY